VSRNTRLSIRAYSKELPQGVRLVRNALAREFVLIRTSDGEALASRGEAEVLRWKRPARVFSSIAHRELGLRKCSP
jgi:hypothetical protein